MDEVYKADPTFINFVPRTAAEAVDRFTRCRRRGLSAYRIPECVIECARGLSPLEMDRFETWLVNPMNVDVVNIHPNNDISERNNEVQKEVYDEVFGGDLKAERLPPIPNLVDMADLTESFPPRRQGCEEEVGPASLARSPDSAPALPPARASGGAAL